MSTTARWVVGAVAAALVVALLVWGRGDDHHHGDEVGSVATVSR